MSAGHYTHSGIRRAYSRSGSCSSNSTRIPSCITCGGQVDQKYSSVISRQDHKGAKHCARDHDKRASWQSRHPPDGRLRERRTVDSPRQALYRSPPAGPLWIALGHDDSLRQAHLNNDWDAAVHDGKFHAAAPAPTGRGQAVSVDRKYTQIRSDGSERPSPNRLRPGCIHASE